MGEPGADWQPLLRPACLSVAIDDQGSIVHAGSAVVVDERAAVTVAHVAERADGGLRAELVVETETGESIRCTTRRLGESLCLLVPTDAERAFAAPARLHPARLPGDPLVSFGFPTGDYARGGQPSRLEFVGDSSTGSEFRPRVRGTTLRRGTSGSPVLNLRTGGVCGLVNSSTLDGEGHLVVLEPGIVPTGSPSSPGAERWMDSLSDLQLVEGGWDWPTRRLRGYAERLLAHAETHPYPGVLFDATPPPLSSIHIRQSHSSWNDPEHPVPPGEDSSLARLVSGGVLVGQPGGGKSSALRMLAREMCLDFERGQRIRVPILVNAVDIEPESGFAGSLARAVNRDLFAGEERIDAAFFERAPLPGASWHLLLDGLDEVLDGDRRLRVVEKLTEYAARVDSEHPTIGTRALPPEELRAIADRVGGRVFELQSFDLRQVPRVMSRWFDAFGHPDPDRMAITLLARLREQKADALLRNPLMLTMVCQLAQWRPEDRPPSNRNDVYARFTGALRERFFAEGAPNAGRQAESIVARYGRAASLEAETVVQQAYHRLGFAALDWLDTDELPILADALSARRVPYPVATRLWERLMHEVTRRSGIAIQQSGQLKFLHQTLAEYLAAWTLADHPTDRDATLERLVEGSGRLGGKHSFLRFAAGLWLGRPEFAAWLVELLHDRRIEDPIDLVADLVADGQPIPEPVGDAFAHRLLETLERRAGRPVDAVRAVQRLASVAGPEAVDRALVTVLARDDLAGEDRGWAVIALAGWRSGSSRRLPEPDPSALGSIELAMRELVRTGDDATLGLIEGLADDPGLDEFVRETAREVLDTSGRRDRERVTGRESPISMAALRRLVPRLFSRAQPADAVDALRRAVRARHPKADLALVDRAVEVAERGHAGRRRTSGEAYLGHPVAVAQILAELGLDVPTVIAALLHDAVDHALDASGVEELRAEFGDEVARLVDGTRRLDRISPGDSSEAETVGKMIVAMSTDLRVLAIMLAVRLHDARTWGFLPADSAARAARETLDVFAPLARRLGMQAIGLELEDLSFAVLHPKLSAEIESLVRQRVPGGAGYVSQVVELIETELRRLRVRAVVTGRLKSSYSIYQRMVVDGRDFDEIFDLVGIRVIVDSVRDCYAALSQLHASWAPLPGRFTDYIATPKFNLYQSLHTTVIGPDGRTVEIQIRTHEMHERAEVGSARRIERATGGPAVHDARTAARLANWAGEAADSGELLDALRAELGARETYVFTPMGRIIGLPVGATPVDFAYAVHTEVGHRTIGAKVNGRLVPLESELGSGDVVEILTAASPDAGPSEQWLRFVVSTRARRRIRQRLRARPASVTDAVLAEG